MIYNITLFVICFNVATAVIGVSGVFDTQEQGDIINFDSINQYNEQQLDARTFELNNTESSWISNLLPDIVDQGADFVRGAGQAISLFMIGIVSPAAIIDDICMQVANDPNQSGTCSQDDGLGVVTKWINRLVWLTYVFFLIQFLANRSFRGIE
tara:strand:+ start:39 stop:500 length:462 start_codon:yes stop_codon:yes gene_type:complete